MAKRKNVKGISVTEPNQVDISDKIAGYEEERAEILKLVNIFRNYDKYTQMGIQIPKGLILQGPPGCGKTLLARTIADKCGVDFIEFSHDGEPKDTVKKLSEAFAKAEQHCPSILYIDEIDSIVSSFNFESDISHSVEKFLLTKLDGYSQSKGVMVMASTNNYGDIPEALLRSGRFDKKIKIDLPDLKARVKIIEFYAKGKPLFEGLDINVLASKIKGMSGADIKTLINNTMIEYVDRKEHVSIDDFEKIINEMNFETIGKNWSVATNAVKVLVHEAGHAILGDILLDMRCSISAVKYDTTNGFTKFGNKKRHKYGYDESDVANDETTGTMRTQDGLNDICVSLGGLVAEEMFYGDHSSGVSGDLAQVNNMVKLLIGLGFYGLEFVDFDDFAYWSDRKMQRYNRVASKVVNGQMRRAKRILKKNTPLIKYIVERALANGNCLSEDAMERTLLDYEDRKKQIDAKMRKVGIDELGRAE